MRPSGSFLSSWFLIDDVARHLPAVQAAFPVRFAEHYGRSLHAPEIAVAYEEGRMNARFAEAGLQIRKILYGGWSGRETTVASGQEIIWATRES